MKLRNKKTGELKAVHNNNILVHFSDGTTKCYHSIEELNEEWEDYEEPKVIYYLSWDGVVLHSADKTGWQDAKQIGNYFETKEEAEKAVEKLKAWKRLEDKGFKFEGWKNDARVGYPRINWSIREIDKKVDKDLDLLFGGGE